MRIRVRRELARRRLLVLAVICLLVAGGCSVFYTGGPRYARGKPQPKPKPRPGATKPAQKPAADKRRGVLLWPVQGQVVTQFGTVVDPKYGTVTKNTGIDIATTSGSRVVAVDSGKVSFADIEDVLNCYTAKPSVIEVETQKALAKVREFLPAKIDRAVERFDRGIRRTAEERHEPLPPPEERVKRARSFALSQVWAKRVRRRVVGIIETKHLLPGPDNERHLQRIAVRVWSALNRSRGRRGQAPGPARTGD